MLMYSRKIYCSIRDRINLRESLINMLLAFCELHLRTLWSINKIWFSAIYSNIHAFISFKFITVRDGIDTTTPLGEAMMYLAVIFSGLEVRTDSLRITDNIYPCFYLLKKGIKMPGIWLKDTGDNATIYFARYCSGPHWLCNHLQNRSGMLRYDGLLHLLLLFEGAWHQIYHS